MRASACCRSLLVAATIAAVLALDLLILSRFRALKALFE
jgi:hypothetical protein